MKNKEREKEVVRLYVEEKETCSNIARIVNIQRRNVYRILKRNDIELRDTIFADCSICKKKIINNKGNRTRCASCDTKVRRYRAKEYAVEYLGGCCKKCGWSGDISGFDFHHRIPEEKSFGINAVTVANRKWSEAKKELDKCDLLCALCHRLEHSDYQNENLIIEAKKYNGIIFKK
jgi:predicted RNA-binding Zn-ribbon protein involved in translation (DUF1610 family)